MAKGWISLYRQIEDHWLWSDKPFSKGQAWIDLLILANQKGKKVVKNGELIELESGVVYQSILFLADRWGWDRKKVKRFLRVLECDEMVTVNSTTHGTTITIENYSDFQGCGTTDGTTDGTTTPQPMGQPLPINNNNLIITNNNINNIRGESKRFTPPTVEEVRAYCQERGNGIDAELFVDCYARKGWMVGKNKMKDWKAAVRTWERRDKNQTQVKTEKAKATTFNNFEQRAYDFQELESKLFNR